MEETTYICERCGERVPVDACTMVADAILCPDCVDMYTTVCDCCGERLFLSDDHGDENITLCERCYERHYTHCERCGRVISYSDAYYEDDDEDEPLCYDCLQARLQQATIHDYSYTPRLVFHGERSNERFFGVELEIDGNGKSRKNAGEILNVANEDAQNLYIKSDGSLDCGMELVTHPMTLQYHMEQMPWKNVLRKAVELGYLSHRTTTCGLHVHISRAAFGETEQEQELSIARLLYFVEKFWTELLRFSRRTERQINRWAARYGMKLSPKAVMESAKDSRAGRYTAVNLTNEETVEIRIFRGTLKYNTLIATLQLVNVICDVALFLSDEELQELSWHGFLDRIHEAELIQYLKERNLYKNDPVMYEEDE